MTQETQNKKLTFVCTCNGCLQMPKDYHFTHCSSIVAELNGHYFSPSTMRFFGSRVTGFRVLYSSGGVIITSTQKAGFDDSLGREIVHTYFCKYGNLVEAYHYKNAREAQKNLFEGSDKVDSCTCHGCQIEAFKKAQA
jgi:hypothetical protein